MFRLRWPHPPARLTFSASVAQRSGARASEPRQLPGVVDQKQVARIMEIFPDKVLRRKLELDFVIADLRGVRATPSAVFMDSLFPSPRVTFRSIGFGWTSGFASRMSCPLQENCRSAASTGSTIIASKTKLPIANPFAYTMTLLQLPRQRRPRLSEAIVPVPRIRTCWG